LPAYTRKNFIGYGTAASRNPKRGINRIDASGYFKIS